MGAPRRNRKKFDKPKERWNLERIKNDTELIEQYGLKNMKELWKAQSEISRIRGNARELLSGSSQFEGIKSKIVSRLARLGMINASAAVDELLDLKPSALLERRLQTIVFRKGLARSIRQARQLTVHGFISIKGKRVNRPGFLVDSQLEKFVGYYKPINITPIKKEGATSETIEVAVVAEPVQAPKIEKAAEKEAK